MRDQLFFHYPLLEMAKAEKDLARVLRDNIRYLSNLIAREPPSITSDQKSASSVWASTPEEAFSLYTDTNKVGWVLSFSEILAAQNWPFPAYLDLKHELQLLVSNERRRISREQLGGPWKWLETRRSKKIFALAETDYMSTLFRTHSRKIFEYWKASPLLASKLPILNEIDLAYQRGSWAVCLPAALPLLDFLIREYYAANKHDVSIGTLCAAFKNAKVFPKDLKPGYAVWTGRENPEQGNALARSEDEDLRIIGVFLSSFLEFANIYYAPFKPKSEIPAVLNRHAILHGRTEYWNCEYVSKMLTFFDLTLRLQLALEVLIHGANAPWLRTSRPG